MIDDYLFGAEEFTVEFTSSSSPEKHDKNRRLALSDRTIKDRKIIENMMKQNEGIYEDVERALDIILNGNSKKPNVLNFAKKIAFENGLKIERLMKRSRQALICWFCKNRQLVPRLTEVINASKSGLPFRQVVQIAQSDPIDENAQQEELSLFQGDEENFNFYDILDDPMF